MDLQITTMVGIGFIVWALSVLVGVAANIASIKANTSRNPPLERSLYEQFARKDEVEAVESRHTKAIESMNAEFHRTFGELFGVVRQLQSSTQVTFSNVERCIGRLEGTLHDHMSAFHKPEAKTS